MARMYQYNNRNSIFYWLSVLYVDYSVVYVDYSVVYGL